MKKNNAFAMLAALAGLSVAVAPTNMQNQTTANEQTQTNRQQPINQPPGEIAEIPIHRLRELHPSGTYAFNPGNSPKQFGQFLQATGRQKWCKKGGAITRKGKV